jgi:hypothetical protein
VPYSNEPYDDERGLQECGLGHDQQLVGDPKDRTVPIAIQATQAQWWPKGTKRPANLG